MDGRNGGKGNLCSLCVCKIVNDMAYYSGISAIRGWQNMVVWVHHSEVQISALSFGSYL